MKWRHARPVVTCTRAQWNWKPSGENSANVNDKQNGEKDKTGEIDRYIDT